MNVRRASQALLLAAALTAVPAVAVAYEADEYDVGVSTTTPAPGESFDVTVVGPVGNPTIALTVSSPDVPDTAITIAGTKTLSKATTDGAATFTVTLTEPGTFALVATDADGSVLSSQQVTVTADAASGGATDGGDDSTGTGGAEGAEGTAGVAGGDAAADQDASSGGLAATGSEVLLIAGAATALVLGGAGAVVAGTRRRRGQA